jgi:tyrosyl-tRNA synthetase
MQTHEKVELISRLTHEIVSEEELTQLFETKPSPHAYIGFAPTGKMHIGYMIPIRKIVDFLQTGCTFTFLIADLHAYLDDNKSPWELLDARFEYYKQGIIGILKAFDAPLDNVQFVRGSDFEFEREYQENILQMVGDVTLNRAKRAASEVIRFSDEPKLGGFVYPFMQIEDVYALDADIALGGIDQRGIYMLGRDVAEKMNRDKYVCVFTPLLPGLTGAKMSASDENSKIDLLDDKKTLKKKISKAFCPAGEVENNGVLAFIEYVIFPLQNEFKISRPEKFGGNVDFSSYKQLEDAFVSEDIHPMDLKNALFDVLAPLLEVVQVNVDVELVEKAYN